MAGGNIKQGGDVFIVDNSDQDWKVRRYLHGWADLAHTVDIGTGYFEVGGLFALYPFFRPIIAEAKSE